MSTLTSKKETIKSKSLKFSVPTFVMSALISYSINQSVWWCALHGLCGWLYLIYWAVTQDPNIEDFSNIINFYTN